MPFCTYFVGNTRKGRQMLPILKKKEGSMAYTPDHLVRKSDEPKEYDIMHSVAEDMLHAINSKNVKMLAETIKAAFELCEAEEHEEGEV
jgi:hypothetical protein